MFISYSRFSTYLQCGYKHHLLYNEKIVPKKTARPLYFGTDFHSLLEVRRDRERLQAKKEEIEHKFSRENEETKKELGETYLQDIFEIFGDYSQVWEEEVLPTLTEEKFSIPLFTLESGEVVYFVGVIDELYKRKNKQGKYLYIGEHKTFTNRPDPSFFVMNSQRNLYCEACKRLYGMYPSFCQWDYIKSTPAAEPIWLPKQGRFSNAKTTSVTPYSYLRACQKLGVTDSETLAQSEIYRDNVSKFFFREATPTIPQMTTDIFDGFVYICREIAKGGSHVKNFTKDCSWCPYNSICKTEMEGGNRNDIINLSFKEKERV